MPNNKIPPSGKISKQIMETIQNLSQYGHNEKLLDRLVELSLRKLVQELLEEEAKNYIGQDYYGHGNRNGYRNGYKPAHLKTAENKLLIQKPQVSDCPEPFKSQLWPHLKGHTQRLEKIAIEMYARGCSTRDIEELLKDRNGHILLSKSAISRLNERLWEEYEAFCKSDLSDYDIVYIFCDAVYESLRLHKSRKEGILVVWGILSSGAKILLALQLGNKESYNDWLGLFRDLRKRGLKDPVLGVSDGAPGLIQSFEEVFPKTLRQRCLVHKKRNILNKVPSESIPEVKAYLDNIYYAPDKESAYREAASFRDKFAGIFPSAVKSFDEDLDACLAHLECPVTHRKHITSTNLVERSFLEERRRSKVIPRFFDEKSGLKIAFASLIRASQTWRRIKFAFNDHLKIIELREKLRHDITKVKKERLAVHTRKPRISHKQKVFFQKK